MNEAIRKSIEKGGLNPGLSWLTDEQLYLTPSFWQALGRALGWEKECCSLCGSTVAQSHVFEGEYDARCKGCGTEWLDKAEFPDEGVIIPEWLYHWHCFIDWIADGKTPDSFFEELIKNQ